MSNYGLNATIAGNLTKPSKQWFWWYNIPQSGFTWTFINEFIIPKGVWTPSPSDTTGTASILSSLDGTDNGGSQITFPVTGKYTISFTAPFGWGSQKSQLWWTVNSSRYDATNNTTLWKNSLGWSSPPNTFAGTVTFSGIFDAGDKVYPVMFSTTHNSLPFNAQNRWSMSVVLDYECPP